MRTVLWVVLPYAAVAVFVLGHLWRWRFDRLGWTSRSSELLEKRWLSIGSPLFHFGLLGVAGGHVVGLLVPARTTRAVGVSDHLYHLGALILGGAFGAAATAGIVILTLRRVLVPAVRRNGAAVDLVVDVALLVLVCFGMGETLGWNLGVGEYAYRDTISVWLRDLVTLQPHAALMAGAPWVYKAHVLTSLVVFSLWPFSRLVHVWTVPLQYLVRRAHILYRPLPERSSHAHPARPA